MQNNQDNNDSDLRGGGYQANQKNTGQHMQCTQMDQIGVAGQTCPCILKTDFLV